jgi:hypothetical protein
VRRAPLLTLLALLALCGPAAAAPRLSDVGTFAQPVYVAAPPGDAHRLFVVEKEGTIKVMVDGGTPATFLDIHDEVVAGGERGLLSMAFAPDYATSGRFYVYFTAPRPGDSAGSVIHIDELRRSDADPQAADESRRRTLLTIDHPTFSNHDGGQLQTGPDGMLWIGTGDGGSGNDPANNAQNTRSLLGKLLRIDPNPTATAAYGIPSDNPYADGAAAAPEIWAYGLRNPWRFSFDRATGDLTIGDVGQGTREEVDFAARGTDAGVDYGWRCFEGTIHTPGISPPCDPADDVFPVLEKNHSSDGYCAIVGGYVVRDPSLGGGLLGRYLYGDFCNPTLRSAQPAAGGLTDDRAEPLSVAGLTSFGEDACGRLYAASRGAGAVFRLEGPTPADCTPPPPPPGGSTGTTQQPSPPDTGTGVPPADDDPPGVALNRARAQRLLENRSVAIGVRCDEACRITAGGTLTVGNAARTYRLQRVKRALAARSRTRLRLRVPKKSLPAIRRALAAGRPVRALVTITARDSLGNGATTTAKVRGRR